MNKGMMEKDVIGLLLKEEVMEVYVIKEDTMDKGKMEKRVTKLSLMEEEMTRKKIVEGKLIFEKTGNAV